MVRLRLLMMTLVVAACGAPGTVPVARDAPSSPPAVTGAEAEEVPAGLVAYDPYQPVANPPPVQALLDLPTCADHGPLASWMADALAPFGDVADQPLVPVALAEVMDTTPVLRDVLATCALAGVRGGAEGWELRANNGTVIARGVASEGLIDRFGRVYERQGVLGGVNFGQSLIASQQLVAGVMFGQRMELELSEIRPRHRALLVVELPFTGEVTRDLEGQLAAERQAARLTTSRLDTPSWSWPLPVPRALPPGFVRCAGPFPSGGFQTTLTELCNEDGDTVRVSTGNKGANPVPDPPFTTAVVADGDRLRLDITTAVEDVAIDVPARLGRDLLERMSTTVPLLDRRVWLPAEGRPGELQSVYGVEWLHDTLDSAGAIDVEVREAPVGCEDGLEEDGQDCGPGGPSPLEGAATGQGGHRVEFQVWVPRPQPADTTAVPGSVSLVVTVGATDVLVEQGYGGDVTAQCGGVRFRLSPFGVGAADATTDDVQPALELLSTVVQHLDC